jgi:D-alanyl-D-alanine carboxypeptidase (penicillin-binding protein 5/6)
MGFENYTRRVIAEKGGFTKALPISAGKNDTLIVANATKMSALLPVEHGEITLVSEAVLPLVAPISRGDIIGRVVAYENGKKIAESPLVASFDVQRQKYKPEFFKKLKELLGF